MFVLQTASAEQQKRESEAALPPPRLSCWALYFTTVLGRGFALTSLNPPGSPSTANAAARARCLLLPPA